MRIKLEESFAGEFDSPPAELEEKLNKAAQQALAQVLGERLSKAHKRGGEVAVIESLTQMMVTAYEQRMTRLRRDAKELVRARSEG